MSTILDQSKAIAQQQQALSVSRRQLAETFARENLVPLCVELSHQRKTNTLANGLMAQLREIIDPSGDDIYAAQRLVEALAADHIADQAASK